MTDDRRYLNRKGPYWYVQVAVPAELREKFGDRAVIQRSLHTRDLEEARRRRWPVVEEILRSFNNARSGARLTDDMIEAEAQAELQRILAAVRRNPGGTVRRGPRAWPRRVGGRVGD